MSISSFKLVLEIIFHYISVETDASAIVSRHAHTIFFFAICGVVSQGLKLKF